MEKSPHRFTLHIVYAMILGIIVGLMLKYIPFLHSFSQTMVSGFFDPLGSLFISLDSNDGHPYRVCLRRRRWC